MEHRENYVVRKAQTQMVAQSNDRVDEIDDEIDCVHCRNLSVKYLAGSARSRK